MVTFKNSSTSVILLKLPYGRKINGEYILNPGGIIEFERDVPGIARFKMLVNEKWKYWTKQVTADGDYYIHGPKDMVCSIILVTMHNNPGITILNCNFFFRQQRSSD